MKSAVLRLHCQDQKGIVYAISRFIYERGGNIIHAQQHCEELDQRFFMRVYFDRSQMSETKQALRDDLEALAKPLDMWTSLTFSEERKRMAILVSKYDHCLYDLLLRHQYSELNADVTLVVSNHPDLEHVAVNFRVPFFCAPVRQGEKKKAEAQILELLQRHHVDFIALARYMQILTPSFIQSYPNQIINIHHGFLPAFKGARPYHQAYERGVKLIGASSHYATEELDEGPIIEQETIRVSHSHSVQSMLALGREIEKRVLAKAVCAHAEDRIMVYRKRTIVFDD